MAARHTKNLTAGDRRRIERNVRRARSITRSEAASGGSALIWKILRNEKYLRVLAGMMPPMYLEFEAGFVARALRGRHGALFRGGGRRPGGRRRLDPRQVLVAYLVWMRAGMAEDGLGAYLGMDRPVVSRYLCIARDVLGYNNLNPSGISRAIRGARSIRDVQRWIPGGMLYCDGASVEVARPAGGRRGRGSRPGRGRRSITFPVAASDDGLVIGLGAAGPGGVRGAGAVGKGLPDWGRWSGYMRDPGTPDGRRFTVWAGPGYGGLAKVLRGADVNSPYKKPGGRACRHGRKGTTGGLRAAGYTWRASWTG